MTGKGRATVVSFWATWCPPCKNELALYNTRFENWKKNYNVDFLAVSVDEGLTADALKKFATDKGWKFKVLYDNKGVASPQFNITSIPMLLVVDKKGNIIDKHVGFRQDDLASFEQSLSKLK